MAKPSEETQAFLLEVIKLQSMAIADREKIGWEPEFVNPSFRVYDNVTVISHYYNVGYTREREDHVFLNEKLDNYFKKIIRKHGSVDNYVLESIGNDPEIPYHELLNIAECNISSD